MNLEELEKAFQKNMLVVHAACELAVVDIDGRSFLDVTGVGSRMKLKDLKVGDTFSWHDLDVEERTEHLFELMGNSVYIVDGFEEDGELRAFRTNRIVAGVNHDQPCFTRNSP